MNKTKMIRVVYENYSSMLVSKDVTYSQVISNFIDFFPELDKKGVHIEERTVDGNLEWHIVSGKKESKNISYFSYLLINDVYHFVKDMHLQEVTKKIIQVKIGDFFNIKGLGMLQVVNVHYNPYEDNGTTIKEIGITCNRVDH